MIVALFMRAWIEIKICYVEELSIIVALFMRAWIEIVLQAVMILAHIVSPSS